MNTKVLHKINYGLYIISSKRNNKLNGQIANTAFQITSDPKTIAISINKENLTHECIEEMEAFSVSILSEQATMPFIGKFGFKSGRDIDKFEDTNYTIHKDTGLPIISDYSAGYLIIRVIKKVDVFTHTIFIGKIIDGEILSDENPMSYDFYHKVRGGKAPKSAPTYIEEEKSEKIQKGDNMKNYKCTVCGYVYDIKKGDPDNGIEAGTKFEDLPDDWVCPLCGVGKDQFEEIE